MTVNGQQVDRRSIHVELERAGTERPAGVLAAAIHNANAVAAVADMDLSHTPPLGSPWDAVQQAAHAC